MKMGRLIAFILIVALCLPSPGMAQGASLIRDAETEAYLRKVADPIFLEAGLVPQNIRMYILHDDVLNAFVAGGMNMYINTGLITWSKDPRVIAGVIAHETGHIAGGHLIRHQDELEKASIGTVLSYVLGAATIVAGAPAAGQAILTGGSHLAQQVYLRYTRSNEESADQAGVRYLDNLHISAEGLINLLEELNRQQRSAFQNISPYTQTHPLSSERIQFIRNAMNSSSTKTEEPSKREREQYERIVAKILAFLGDARQVAIQYPATDASFPAQYAQAILAHRRGDVAGSVAILDKLIASNPQDGYLAELKGQVYYENGKIADSVVAYRRSLELLPNQTLIRLGLAVSLIATNDKANMEEAVNLLERATSDEKHNAMAWHQLGLAYGKAGDMGMSYVALAEEAMLGRNRKDAIQFIAQARKNKITNAGALLRLEDMEQTLRKWKEEDRKL